MTNMCNPLSAPAVMTWTAEELRTDTPRDRAVARVEDALRARRAACAAYGREIHTADYTTPKEQREARLELLRQAIKDAEGLLAEALVALEEQL